ncbi:hypothetical protein GCM10010430_81580 [Kitasatospora cystarginea]|uniref:SF4 helicase domain-containing protein n=1 Tax=Kitasatospora cystarginea TaxID=58350 RepID=A0ABP5S0M2_9ACTN
MVTASVTRAVRQSQAKVSPIPAAPLGPARPPRPTSRSPPRSVPPPRGTPRRTSASPRHDPQLPLWSQLHATRGMSSGIILLHRPDYYEKESPRAGEADAIVAKNRMGSTFTATLAFQGHYSRFVDMTRDMT